MPLSQVDPDGSLIGKLVQTTENVVQSSAAPATVGESKNFSKPLAARLGR